MRVLRRIAAVLGALLGLVVLAAAGGGLWLRGDAGQRWLLDQLLGLGQPHAGSLAIGSLSTDLTSHLRIEAVVLRDAAGKELVGIDVIDADFSLRAILKKTLRVSRLRVEGLRADVTQTDAGVDLAQLWVDPAAPPAPPAPPAPSAPWAGLPIDLVVDGIDIGATHLGLLTGTETVALTDATLTGALGFDGDRVTVRALALDAASTPDLGPLRLRADATYDPRALAVDTLELTLGPQRLAISGGLGGLEGDAATAGVHLHALHLEPEALPWDLPLRGVFDLTGEVTGLVAAPIFALQIATPGGRVDVEATLDRRPARPTWSGSVQSHAVALDAFVRDLAPTVLDARVTATGAGLGWPDDLDADVTIAGTAPHAGPVADARVDAHVTLAGGVATVHDLAASTSSGAIAAEARIDLVHANLTATVSALAVDLADLARFGVADLRGTARFEGAAEADWSGATPAATIDGTLSGEAIGYQTAARVAALEGPVHLAWAEEAGRVTATLTLRALTASSARLARADLEAHGTVAKGGDVALAARVTATGITGPVAGNRATATLSVVGDALVARVDLVDALRTVVGIDARGDLATRRFAVPRLIVAPEFTQTWVGQGTQTVTLADDGFDDLRLELTSGVASIRAGGSLHTRGAVALDLAVAGVPLAMLELASPDLAGCTGTAGITGIFGGTWRALTLAVDARADAVVVPGVLHGLFAKAHVEGADGAVRVEASLADATQALVTLAGSVPLSLDMRRPGLRVAEPVDLVLDVPAGTAEVWNAVLDTQTLPPIRGLGTVRLAGTPVHPDVHVVATIEVPAANTGDPWIALDLDAAAHAEELRVEAAVREGDDPRGALVGTARLPLDGIAASLLKTGPRVDLADPGAWLDALDVTVTPDLPLQSLAAFVDVPEGVEGRLRGALRVTGTPTKPVLAADLRVDRARLDALAVSPATLAVSPAPGGYALDANLGFGADGSVHVVAFVPIELAPGAAIGPQLQRRGLAVEVSGDGIPLRAVSAVWPEMQEASGRLRLGGSLHGSIVAPAGDLAASLADGAFRLESTGVAYDQVGFELVVDPAAIRLQKLHVRTRAPGEDPERAIQGTLDGAVVAGIEGTTLGEWRGNLSFHRTLLSAAGDRYLRLSTGELGFSGVPPNVTVNGALHVEEARFNLDEHFFRGLEARSTPAWLHVHRRGSAPQAEASPLPPPGIPAWLTARLALDLDRNTFLRARLPLGGPLGGLLGPLASVRVDTQADGQLNVGVKDGVLSVDGQVLPLRGTTVLFGKPFELRDDSTISFTGRDFASPVLDLHAEYDTRAYGVVDATIRGVPDALEVTLSSSTYPAQDDVISLLLVGKPASEMSAGEGASDGASAAAMSMLLTTVGQTLGQEGEKAAAMVIAPDLLVVGNETARVGKRIGRRLFVVVDIDSSANDRSSSYLLLTLELALGGPWETEFTHGTAGEDSLEVNWTRRY